MMRVAVTGSCGHLGANLVRELIDENIQVRALYRTPLSLVALKGLDVETIQIDVLKPETLTEAFRDVDVVVHLAAIISIDGDKDGRVTKTNVVGPRNVARACLESGVAKLVHVSSIHAMKIKKSDPVVDESHPAADTSSFRYDYSKALGEKEVLAAVEKDLDVTILNPTGILGPHDFGPSHAGQMLRDLFNGRMPFLLDGGFDWVDARDVSHAIIMAAKHAAAGNRYILSGHWASFDELSRMCNEISGSSVRRMSLPVAVARAALPLTRLSDRMMGRESLFTHESLHIIENANQAISSHKASRAFNYSARPLRDTLADTFRWWRIQGLV